MIAKIKGKIDFLKENYVVIDVNGIGYKVFLTAYASGKLAGKEEASFFVHTHVREDILALYGFLSVEELDIFELLISVSGIGPKAAGGILSVADPKTIQTAILNEDPSILTRVSGVGKKTAERVILELRNKIPDISSGERKEALLDNEAMDALLAMGYTVTETREALKSVSSDISDVGEKVKAALRNLGKN